MKNSPEIRSGDTIIKFRTRKARICYVCRFFNYDLKYCRKFKKYISAATEAVICEAYKCVFTACKVKCTDCNNLSYGYYCEELNGPAPYLNREKECSSFKPKPQN